MEKCVCRLFIAITDSVYDKIHTGQFVTVYVQIQ